MRTPVSIEAPSARVVRASVFVFCSWLAGCSLISGENDLHLRPDASAGSRSVDAGTGGARAGGGGGSGGSGGSGGALSGGAGGSGGAGPVGTGGASSGGSLDAGPDADAGSGGVDAGPPTCAAGTIDCGDLGCISNDVHNCGTCGHDCTRLPNVSGTVTCATDGTCAYGAAACTLGFGICSSNPDEGCAEIDTKEQCGTCGRSCAGATPVCAKETLPDGGAGYDCASGCPTGQQLCGSACADLLTDPQHCGSCTRKCPTDPAGKATCTNGATCDIVCNSGTHLCGGVCVSSSDPKNCGSKCATNCPSPTSGGGSATCNGDLCALSCPAGLSPCSGACLDVTGSDASNCGSCGNKCGGGKVCSGGSCVCPSGQHDCGGTCSSDTSVNSCGTTSCTPCSAISNATVACVGGACGIGSCNTNFGDCDGKSSTGCETNLLTSSTNCKTCGHVCVGGSCSSGACTCTGGLTNCSDTCVNTNTDSTHCGSCTNVCGSGSSCQSGLCCPSGTSNCSGTCVTTSNNDNNCGGCGLKCTGGQTCQGTSCVCPAGTSLCGGSCVNFQTDSNNCGTCAHSCFSGACSAGVCQPWTVVDSPASSSVADLKTDGTRVVWVDTGLKQIRQVNSDGTGVMTLSAGNQFQTLLDPFHRIMSLGGGVVIVSVQVQGLFKAVVNSPSTASFPLSFSNLPVSSTFTFNVGVNAAGTRVGVMTEAPSPASSQIWDCPISGSSCSQVGSPFSSALFGAAANATNYYFPNQGGGALQYIKFGGPYSFQSLTTSSQSGFISLDSSNAYFIDNTDVVMSVPLIGGNKTTIVTTFPANTGNFADFTTDGKNVYYTAFGNPARLGYAPVGGFSDKSVKIITSLSAPAGVTAGGGKVFWSDGATIYGMAAP